MEDSISTWEGEGGSFNPVLPQRLTGTAAQIEWAERIRDQVQAEFDRVASVLEAAARKQSESERQKTHAMMAILEDKRVEVMANERAGYFIHGWQELGDQVRKLITSDARYKALRG